METTEKNQQQMARRLTLDQLYKESRNWLSELAFWHDEAEFMEDLLKKHCEYLDSELQLVFARLVDLLHNDFKRLQIKVEALCSTATKAISVNESKISTPIMQEYLSLNKELQLFREEISSTKREVFSLMRVALKRKKGKGLA